MSFFHAASSFFSVPLCLCGAGCFGNRQFPRIWSRAYASGLPFSSLVGKLPAFLAWSTLPLLQHSTAPQRQLGRRPGPNPAGSWQSASAVSSRSQQLAVSSWHSAVGTLEAAERRQNLAQGARRCEEIARKLPPQRHRGTEKNGKRSETNDIFV
jgi:hypothetical protein